MKQIPTVMQLCLTLDTGGLERVVVSLANELVRQGEVRPLICTVGQTRTGVMPATLAPEVDWHELQGPPHFSTPTAMRLAASVWRNGVTLIHAHGTQPLVYALTASLFTHVPVVFTKHSSHEDLEFFARHPLFQKLALRKVQHFVGVAPAATARLCEVFHAASARCATVINGTALPSAARNRQILALRNGRVARGPHVITTVCRLAPEKDLFTLLEAFNEVHGVCPNSVLWIVGDGPARATLMRRTGQLDLTSHVRFWGPCDHVQDLLLGSDVFVNSSVTEGVSISILEAMAMALPVVATAVGGTPSIVKHEQTGLLVAPQQPRELAEALVRVLRQDTLRKRLGANGLGEVQAKWSLTRMAESYLELYRQALAPESLHASKIA